MQNYKMEMVKYCMKKWKLLLKRKSKNYIQLYVKSIRIQIEKTDHKVGIKWLESQ